MPDTGIMPQSQQLAAAQALTQTVGVLKTLALHYSNANIIVDKETTLAQLTECDFPGYAVTPSQDASNAYQGIDGLVHADFPSSVFIATAGQTQQTTATVVGTITTAGNAEVIVTSAGMPGSPITLTVAVALGDTASVVAQKVAAAMLANAAIAARFNVSVAGPAIRLTRKVAAANDATLNVATDNDTSAGLTPEPTSAATRAGATTGNNVSDVVRCWYYTTQDGATLALAGNLAVPVALTGPGQGGTVDPEWIYGR